MAAAGTPAIAPVDFSQLGIAALLILALAYIACVYIKANPRKEPAPATAPIQTIESMCAVLQVSLENNTKAINCLTEAVTELRVTQAEQGQMLNQLWQASILKKA